MDYEGPRSDGASQAKEGVGAKRPPPIVVAKQVEREGGSIAERISRFVKPDEQRWVVQTARRTRSGRRSSAPNINSFEGSAGGTRSPHPLPVHQHQALQDMFMGRSRSNYESESSGQESGTTGIPVDHMNSSGFLIDGGYNRSDSSESRPNDSELGDSEVGEDGVPAYGYGKSTVSGAYMKPPFNVEIVNASEPRFSPSSDSQDQSSPNSAARYRPRRGSKENATGRRGSKENATGRRGSKENATARRGSKENASEDGLVEWTRKARREMKQARSKSHIGFFDPYHPSAADMQDKPDKSVAKSSEGYAAANSPGRIRGGSTSSRRGRVGSGSESGSQLALGRMVTPPSPHTGSAGRHSMFDSASLDVFQDTISPQPFSSSSFDYRLSKDDKTLSDFCGPSFRHFTISRLLTSVLRSRVLFLLSFVASVWVLVGRSVYFATNEATDWDAAAFGMSTASFVILALEMALLSHHHRLRYVISFAFLLDFLATISLIPEMVALSAPDTDLFWLNILGISRVARVADRGGGLVKVLRSIPKKVSFLHRNGPKSRTLGSRERERLKQKGATPKDESLDSDQGGVIPTGEGNPADVDMAAFSDSPVGLRLDKSIAKIQVILVFIVIAVVHLLDIWGVQDVVTAHRHSIVQQMHLLQRTIGSGVGGAGREVLIQSAIDAVIKGSKDGGYPICLLSVGGQVLYAHEKEGRRKAPNETREITFRLKDWSSSGSGGSSDMDEDAMHVGIVRFDIRKAAVEAYVCNLAIVLGVVLVLVGGTGVMSEFVFRDVGLPLQRMVALVRAFAVDPLKPLAHRESESSLLHPLRETVVLENSIVRLSRLLQLGFGEAGAAMVGRSLNETSDATQGALGEDFGKILNVGRVVHAFFGFCDICYFTDLTEILQADVVRVVNTVAKVVHRSVKDNYGAPNKNMGDTFLVVWMCKAGLGVRTVADASLRSFIRAVLEVSSNKEIRKMSGRSDVQTRMPGFKVQLGFGLHYGWAIECAIGSDLKIDASYLSPNVNLASRLQFATKQYGVEILISGQTHSLFSPSVQAMCRLVDRVTLKGTMQPMNIYTYDLPATTVDGISVIDDHIISSPETSHQLFFNALQPATSDRFRQQFNTAMEHYLGGQDGSHADWPKAAAILSILCSKSGPRDGPSQAIRSYIKRRARPDGNAPSNWKGYRALDSK